MNLEVTLFRFDDFAKFEEHEKAIEREGNLFYYEKYGIKDSSDVWKFDQEILSKMVKQKTLHLSKLGLTDFRGTSVYYPHRYVTDSALYPDHEFKIGYFRSQLYKNGFNTIVFQHIGETLFSIFEVDCASIFVYKYIQPKWIQAFYNILKAKEQFIQAALRSHTEIIAQDYIIKSFDIMAETCNHIISRPDSDNFRLCWRL